MSRDEKRAYLVVFAVALATRLVAASKVALLDRDGVWFLKAAGYYASGDFASGLAFHYPPGFPVLAALAQRLGLDPEPGGLLVSALVGAFGAVFAAGIAARWGRRALWVAGLTVALQPANVELGCAVTADALFAAVLLGALLAAQNGRWSITGALAGASYLVRPEGVIAIFVLALRGRRKAPWVLGAAALLVIPYMAAIKSLPTMSGQGAGEWKLSRKRDVLTETEAAKVFPRGANGRRSFSMQGAARALVATAKRFAKLVYHVLHAAQELLLVLLVLLALRRERPRGAPDVLPLVLLLGYAVIRDDPRYGSMALALVLPWLGAWLARLARPRWVLAVVLIAPLLVATRARHTAKATWREAGVLCTGYEKIASSDPRVAFYAHAPVFIDTHVTALDEARAQGAQVLVVKADDPIASVCSTRGLVLRHATGDAEPVLVTPLK